MENGSHAPSRKAPVNPAEDDRRDYDPADYKHLDDRRFRYAKNEALFAQVLCLVSVIATYIVAYAMCPKDISRMTYILGFPTWFVAATGVALAAYVIMVVYCGKFSREFSLDAREEETEGSENARD